MQLRLVALVGVLGLVVAFPGQRLLAEPARPSPADPPADAARVQADPWEQPKWHERPKRGISAFTAALADVTRPRRRTSTSRALLATRARAGP